MATQNRLRKVQVAIATGMLVVLAGMQNCSNVGFTSSNDSNSGQNTGAGPGPGPSPGPGNNTCNETVLQTITTPVKILAVVDTSGSNVGDSSHAGTDPNKSKRGGSMQAFFNQYGGKQNFFWSLVTFQGSAAHAVINYNGNDQTPGFTASGPVMQNAINYFYSITDDGQTPYKAALNLAKAAITGDATDTAQTKYIIVFLSDGLPTDYTGSNIDAQISSDVQALVGLKAGRISFSTVYYGPNDATASNRLKMMANAGQGQFFDTNTNPSASGLLINNVVTVPGSNCPTN